jgi:zinc protease
MFEIRRALAPLAVTSSLLALIAGASPGALAQAARPAAASTPRVWAQDHTDVTPDPALRFGVLPNGLRYILMHNATPPHQASIRMRFDVGSLMETDEQAGLAHFIEHMAFEGSTHVKPHEMVKILERHGLAFGADTNASTSWDETVYQLDLPQADDETLDTGLMLMRETGGELTFDKAALENERGVVLSEERQRDTPGARVGHKAFDYLFEGQLTPRRWPIGDVNVIKTAPPERLADLYRHYYRPERAVLVVVGDFDLDRVEQKIRDRFSDWRGVGPAGADPVIGPVKPRQTETRLVVEPGAQAMVDINWLSPPELDRDSSAYRREMFTRALGFAVLNRRLERIARSPEPPFIAAGAHRATTYRSADVVDIRASLDPQHFAEAITALESEAKRAAQYGVTPAELEREITDMRASLRAQAEGESTRKTADLATEITDTLGEDEVVTSPSQDLALFEDAVKGLDAPKVSNSLKAQFEGVGPLVFAVAPTEPKGGQAALAQAFEAARLAEVTPPSNAVLKTWAYTHFGPPGRVAETHEIADLDTTFVRFENGVRLTVKPTKFDKNQVKVLVRAGDGRLGQPRDRISQTWALGDLYIEGGLKDLTAEELEQVLNGKVYGASFGMTDDAFMLSGDTRPEDFATQLQVLTAYLVHPGWREEAWTRMKTYGLSRDAQLQSTPGGVFSRDGGMLLKSGDKRWAFPTRADIEAGRLEDLKQFVSTELADGPIEVVVVGDITVEEAVRQTALTFGALPPRPPGHTPPAEARAVRFPAPVAEPVHLTHRGRADQAVGYIAWPTVDFFSDPQRARQLRLLQLVMQLRVTDVLRNHQGVTYSPQTGYDASWDYPGYGYLSAAVEAPPEKLDGFFRSVSDIAKSLRESPVSADELNRALSPRLEQLQKAEAGNDFWLYALAGGQGDPRRLDAIRSAIAGLERVTPAQIQAAAQTYLRDDKAYRLVITPESRVATTPAGAGQGAGAVTSK